MSRHPSRPEPLGTTAHVWSQLSRDLQQRAVQLLTQLAYAQVQAHAPPTAKENHHVHTLPASQNPPRSS